MWGATVADHLPMGAGTAHLVLEVQDVWLGHEGTIRSVKDQHFRFDPARFLGFGGLEAPWKLTTQFKGALARASSKLVVPPKQ